MTINTTVLKNIRIIKIGGNVVDNPELLEKFIIDFAAVEGPKVLVHGGGVMASQMQKALGQQPVMIEGRRVTDEAALRVVTMVYAGWCSKSIVALMQKHGCNALGLCGADANLIEAVKRPPVAVERNGVCENVDYGFVGDVSKINSGFLLALISQGITPVICAITHDKAGSLLNTNADTVASSVAVAMARGCMDNETGPCGVSLIYCFEKDGVLYDKDDDSSLIPEITPESYAELKAEGRVAAGMIPKLDNSFRALESGVAEVIIKHARNLSNVKGTRLHI